MIRFLTFWRFGSGGGTIPPAAATTTGGAGPDRQRKKRSFIHEKKRLFFESIEQVKAFLEGKQEEAHEALEALPDKVVVTNGKPKLSIKPQVVKIETDDSEIRKMVKAVNRKIQADYDRTVAILMNLMAQQMAEDDDLEAILLTL